MNIRISSFVFCLLLFSQVEGKAQTSITDTVIQIRNVTVSAERRQRDNNIGSRRSDIQSVLLESSKTQTLGELLSENSLVYIKSLGQGTASSNAPCGDV